MAYSATVLAEARLQIAAANEGIQKHELRMPNFGAFRAHLDNSNRLIAADIQQIRKTSAQTVKLPVHVRGTDGSGTTRKCAGTGTGTTALVTPVFETIVEEFALSYLEMANNDLTYQQAFTRQLFERMRSAYKRLEGKSVGNLESHKSAVNAGGIYGTTLGSAKRVPYADRDELWAALNAEMMSNDNSGLLDIVANPNLAMSWAKIAQQGAGNSTNMQYALDDLNAYWSRFVTNGTGVFGTAYAFEPGTIGVVPWINQLARDGKDIGTDIWTTFTDPIYGITWELKVKKDCGDSTAAAGAGAEADYRESFVLSAEFAFLSAYSSNTDTGIYKYEVLNAA